MEKLKKQENGQNSLNWGTEFAWEVKNAAEQCKSGITEAKSAGNGRNCTKVRLKSDIWTKATSKQFRGLSKAKNTEKFKKQNRKLLKISQNRLKSPNSS